MWTPLALLLNRSRLNEFIVATFIISASWSSHIAFHQKIIANQLEITHFFINQHSTQPPRSMNPIEWWIELWHIVAGTAAAVHTANNSLNLNKFSFFMCVCAYFVCAWIWRTSLHFSYLLLVTLSWNWINELQSNKNETLSF